MLKHYLKISFILSLLVIINNCAPMYDYESFKNYYQAPRPQFKDYAESSDETASTSLPPAEKHTYYPEENWESGIGRTGINISPEEELELMLNEYLNLGQPVPPELQQKAQNLIPGEANQYPHITKRSLIKNIDIDQQGNQIRFIIQTSRLPQYQANVLKEPNRYRVYIDFLGTRLATATRKQKINNPVIYQLRSGQFKADVARVVVDARREMPYRVYADQNTQAVILEISGNTPTNIENTQPTPFIELPELQPYRPAEMGLAQELGLRIQRIIIDAGHGGSDPGAVGPSGVQEKDVVYDIAVRLKELIRRSGEFEVYLTRDHHENPPLIERTQFANYMRGDLFLSIHANAHRQPDKNGVETYYLALANDEESHSVAAFENSAAGMEYNHLPILLEDILKNSKTKESEHLARTVQSQLVSETRLDDRGVRHAGFVVLVGAQMPSVLVEVGFLSNPIEEQRLASKNYRERVAHALFKGIFAYARQSSTVAMRESWHSWND